MPIPVIDLFAGPGGLGEGFSSVLDDKGGRIFDIKLSIEKEVNAHETLELRSFCRQFKPNDIPDEYYELLKINNKTKWKSEKKDLYAKYKEQSDIAKSEAWNTTLGEESDKIVDKRIREGIKGEKNWVLIGGPPCQAFSLAGRSRVGGIHSSDNRVFLYKEYLRIIAKHQPAIFVMENVKGLLSATLDGRNIFNNILNDLAQPSSVFPSIKKGADYNVFSLVKEPIAFGRDGKPLYKEKNDFLIKSEKYGIPQKRHRVILLGIRSDLKISEVPRLKEVETEITLRNVICELPKIRSGISRKIIGVKIGKDGRNKLKYKNINDSPLLWKKIVESHRDEIINHNGFIKLKYNITLPKFNVGADYLNTTPKYSKNPYKEWFEDEKLKGIYNHESRTHLKEDLARYFFASIFLKEYNRFPRMHDYPANLLPKHKNALSGKFADRFRVQVPDQPATTITSHISKDGHYFIHYDPTQCRSLTVREAARVQTFPDNYYFCGSRTAQYVQVGNAVPPYLAYQIAKIVKQIL